MSANLSGLYPSASLTRLNPKEINLQSVQPSGSKRHASPTTAARLHSICGEIPSNTLSLSGSRPSGGPTYVMFTIVVTEPVKLDS